MGKLEDSVRAEIRRTRINKAIIGTLIVGGGLPLALVAPNVLGALGKLGLLNVSQKKQTIAKSLNRLIERGYVEMRRRGTQTSALLTLKGERFAARIGEGSVAPKKPKRWDGKWRVLIFDIPERSKNTREQIRQTLLSIGFQRLQDSVWVYPYDCEDFITVLKFDFRIGKDLLYVIADHIEQDISLRTHFGLTRS